MYKFIGIDISKQTFDVCFPSGKHQQYPNQKGGFQKFLKGVKKEDSVIVVMEASGPYYVRLATFLYEEGMRVCVENPLKIKRFSQMNLNRAKTDKKDAQVIRDYGDKMGDQLKRWAPDPKHIVELRQLNTSLSLLSKQIGQTSRQLEAFQDGGHISKEVKKSLKSIPAKLKREKEKLEKEMLSIAQDQYKDTLKSLTSIPGIGSKTAIMLITLSSNFEKFEHYKQLVAYIGFSPRIYQSGTSVKGRGHICKMGNSQVRKLLYLCTWNAKFKNKACVQMYKRLKAKGKPERVIKVALANKLIKQCFAIGKNKTIYDENYVSKICF